MSSDYINLLLKPIKLVVKRLWLKAAEEYQKLLKIWGAKEAERKAKRSNLVTKNEPKEHEWGGRVCKEAGKECYYCTELTEAAGMHIYGFNTTKCKDGDEFMGI